MYVVSVPHKPVGTKVEPIVVAAEAPLGMASRSPATPVSAPSKPILRIIRVPPCEWMESEPLPLAGRDSVTPPAGCQDALPVTDEWTRDTRLSPVLAAAGLASSSARIAATAAS